MRTAHSNISVVRDDQGQTLGVRLGLDFVSEHEWGIQKMLRRFGVTEKPRTLGVKKRHITACPDGLSFIKEGAQQGLLLPSAFSLAYFKHGVGDVAKELGVSKRKGIFSAWDEESFCITSDNVADQKSLREIYDAFQLKDIAITLLAGNPFGGGGLAFVIVSRLPEEVAKTWHDADKEVLELADYLKETGVETLLQKAGKRWFSLRPCRQKDGSIYFWLNPMEQHRYEAGYFKLEDLQLWAEDKGPVIKQACEIKTAK